MNLKQFFKNKKVLITGHTGFKGAWLTQILLQFEANVIGYSLEPNTNPNLFNILNLKNNIKNYFADIRDYKKIKDVIDKEKPEIVFHLAAQALVRESYNDPLTTYETNVIGTANILNAIRDKEFVKSCVIITTDKVYENKEWIWPYRENDRLGGHDPYSSSKACAEIVVESYRKSFFNQNKTLIASARAGNVIGGGDWAKDRLMTDIVRNIFETNQDIVIRNPNAIRPWQHVLEPLYGYILLSKRLYENEILFSDSWNFGPNENNFVSVEKLLKQGLEIVQKGNYVIKQDPTKHEANLLKLDSTKSKIKLKWEPNLSLNETLQWSFKWYKDYYNKKDLIGLTNEQIKTFFERCNYE